MVGWGGERGERIELRGELGIDWQCNATGNATGTLAMRLQDVCNPEMQLATGKNWEMRLAMRLAGNGTGSGTGGTVNGMGRGMTSRLRR